MLKTFLVAFVTSVLSVGCVHNVPLVVDPAKDMRSNLPVARKIPLKVGMFLSDDLKRYVFKQQKMGMTFQMKAGEYLTPISLQMTSAMFEDVMMVDSLPPYNSSYKPDVEGVIVPEILYSYGDAIGTLSGYIEAKIIIRINAYDLGGNIVWKDEAFGESRSRKLDFVSTFLGGMEEAGKIGYQAGFVATVKILNNFISNPPKELYSLLEIKNVAALKNRHNISNYDVFKNYYTKGRFQFDEMKNYYQALYSFEKAEYLNPNDQSTLFYIGACYAYTSSKRNALEKFNKVIELRPKSEEAINSKKFLNLLKEPLKIIVINYNASNGQSDKDAWTKNASIIGQTIGYTGMFDIIDTNDIGVQPVSNKTNEFVDTLDRCYKKGIKIVVVNEVRKISKKINAEHLSKGDVAIEHIINISSSVYSTRKKEVISKYNIIDKTSTISVQSKEDIRKINEQLLESGAKKLALNLLKDLM
jgi:tetratricopeptide (TPR) repeat protein